MVERKHGWVRAQSEFHKVDPSGVTLVVLMEPTFHSGIVGGGADPVFGAWTSGPHGTGNAGGAPHEERQAAQLKLPVKRGSQADLKQVGARFSPRLRSAFSQKPRASPSPARRRR